MSVTHVRPRSGAAFASIALLVALSACGPGTEPGADSDREYAEAMSEEHAGEEPTPTDATDPTPSGEIESSTVEYAEVDGDTVSGYLARPTMTASVPGVVVIHEWWGLNDNIRAVTDRLAGEGYAALAVDLYGGEAATDAETARRLVQQVQEDTASARRNLRRAVSYLQDELGVPGVGVVGWCFGGGWSLRTALLSPQAIDAAVVYYGRPITDRQRLAALDAPLLGHFGADDDGIPVERVREMERVLDDLGKENEIHVYEGAGHAFANPSGDRYRPEAAEQAWQRTLAFFERHLTGSSDTSTTSPE